MTQKASVWRAARVNEVSWAKPYWYGRTVGLPAGRVASVTHHKVVLRVDEGETSLLVAAACLTAEGTPLNGTGV